MPLKLSFNLCFPSYLVGQRSAAGGPLERRRGKVMAESRSTKRRLNLEQEYQLRSEPAITVPGLKMTPHVITVPLDYSQPENATIDVFFRLVEGVAGSKTDKRYYLLYLQGGPGHEAMRPTEASGWLGKAVQYFTIILLDQRGTGKSSPITAKSLAGLGGPEMQAEYLQHFRADNIVRDSEVIRSVLVGPEERWSILGQSFGGFCCLRYLSAAPQSLNEVFLTGGIPPGINVPCSAHEAYRRLYRRVITQNEKFYTRFPQDVAIVQRLVMHLDSLPEGGAPLPSGGTLTPRALQLLGLAGLGSAGGFERLHFLLERVFDNGELSPVFLLNFESWMPWSSNPLYAVLHESIYCQGAASSWAAHSVRQREYSQEFDAVNAAQDGRPVYFTAALGDRLRCGVEFDASGEMVFPWMFDDFAELRPLKEAASLIAYKSDWPQLYEESVLATNDVPAAAACYFDDMYVDFDMAQDTASRLKSLRQWITNEYMHSGIREDGAKIFDTLLGMTRNSRPLF